MDKTKRVTILSIILAVLVIVLIGLLIYRYGGNSSDTDSPASEEQTSSESDSPSNTTDPNTGEIIESNVDTNDWKTYTDEELGFKLQHPPEADISKPNRTTRRIRFLGPDNEPNTEITDGFTVHITAKSSDEFPASSAQEYAEFSFQQATENETVTVQEPPQPIALSTNREAAVYTIETALGNTAQRYILYSQASGRPYEVDVSVFDPNNQNYEEMTQAILASLEIE